MYVFYTGRIFLGSEIGVSKRIGVRYLRSRPQLRFNPVAFIAILTAYDFLNLNSPVLVLYLTASILPVALCTGGGK